MFGIGGSELIVILIVALLFLGPDKLPDAAKQISKGIRDLKKQSRILQESIENDEHIGGAIRDLRSAMRGDEPAPRPPKPPPGVPIPGDKSKQTILPPSTKPPEANPAEAAPAEQPAEQPAVAQAPAVPAPPEPPDQPEQQAKPAVRLPDVVGETTVAANDQDTEGLDQLVRPADGTVAKGS